MAKSSAISLNSRLEMMSKHSNSQKNISSKLFGGKDEKWIYILGTAVGVLNALITFQYLNNFPFDFGKNLIGVFLPPVITIFYLTYTGYVYGLNRKVFFKGLISYVIQIIPFVPLFFQVFQPTPASDFSRYYVFAKNMLENHTLWGGDKLIFHHVGYHYATQPGYRYFVLIELLIFGQLYRVLGFLNIIFYIAGVYFFQKTIQQVVTNEKLKIVILSLVVLFTPYAVKNILMGIPEWITVILLMCTCYFYMVRNLQWLACFCLGLVPFFRQNLLVSVLLLFVWLLINTRGKLKLVVAFLLPLLLPFYHNLYYAHQWRFFVDIFKMPFLTYADGEVTGWNISLIISNVIHYMGFDIDQGKPGISIIAVLFLPLATVLYFILLKSIPAAKHKVFYLLATLSAIVPAIFLGTAYYPRFEFVNVVIALTTFLFVKFADRNCNTAPGRNFFAQSSI